MMKSTTNRLMVISGAIAFGLLVAVWLVGQTKPNTAPQTSDSQVADKSAAQSKGHTKADARIDLINSIKGPDLYKAYCASCHGNDAKGGGPLAPSLKIKPSDLTRISERNSGTFPFVRIQKIISGELQLISGHGSSNMPVWGPIFSQVTRDDMDLGRVRIDNLTRYLQGIQPMSETR